MQPSKYDPLRERLSGAQIAEVAMSFGEVEDVLGFRLPPSARAHRVWWSNNPGTNVAVRAWRDAGRKTARVDMAAEKVVFVLDDEAPQAGRGETIPSGASRRAATEVVTLRGLTSAGEALIERVMQKEKVDREGAVASIINAEAISRRRRALESIRAQLPKLDMSLDEVVDLIREDRDAR